MNDHGKPDRNEGDAKSGIEGQADTETTEPEGQSGPRAGEALTGDGARRCCKR